MRFSSVLHHSGPVVVALALLALAPADAGALQQLDPEVDTRVRVTGVVAESGTGAPLAGVRVRAGDERATTTDARGRFELQWTRDRVEADAEAVVLRFERLGFAARTDTVAMRASGTLDVEVELHAEALRLDPVSILLQRTRMIGDPVGARAVPGSAFHLSRHDLDRQKLAVDNVHDVLRQVPGVHVTDEEGYGLRPNIGLRGTGTERSSNITLMEDGVLIAPAPYAAPAAYYFPSVGRMDGVEVRTGASQIRYGPRTLGGAVNLLTAPIPEEREWRGELVGGRDALLRAHLRVGDSSARTGWMVEGYSVRTDGFKNLPGGSGTGFDDRDFLGKFRVNSEPGSTTYQQLELKVGYNDHHSDETYLGLTDEDFQARPLFRYPASSEDAMDAEHRQLQLRYFVQPTERTDVVVTAYRHDFDRNWYKLQSVNGMSIAAVLRDPESHGSSLDVLKGESSSDDALRLRANNRAYVSQGVQATFGLRTEGTASVRQNLELGVRVHRDHEDRLQWEDGYRMESERLVRTSSGAPGSQANRLSRASTVAFHAQNEVRAGRWTVVPGVRFESIDFTRLDWSLDDPNRSGVTEERRSSVSAVVPGVGVSYEWSPRTHLFSGVHRGFGPPGPGAGRETRVERSTNYEAGVRIRRAAYGANLTGFFSDYSNILGQSTLSTGGSGVGDLYNGGAVHVFGFEAGLDADLGRGFALPVAVPVRVAYTFSRGTFRTSFESGYDPWGTVEAGDRLPYMPGHVVSGSVGVENPGWGISLGWNASSASRTEAGRGTIPESGIPAFMVLHLAGEVSLGGGVSGFAAVQNLTDERYIVSRRPAGARPGLPRTLFVGIRLSP